MDYQLKFPGGYVDLGEELSQAAVREVREETGINSVFKGIILFRNTHQAQFGRSNLYFICLLNAESQDIVIDEEILDAKWINKLEYAKTVTNPMLKRVMEILTSNKEIPLMSETHLEYSTPWKQNNITFKNTIYSNNSDLKHSI